MNSSLTFLCREATAVSNADYLACVRDGGKVVSHVFCLPASYRKDVLPPTGEQG